MRMLRAAVTCAALLATAKADATTLVYGDRSSWEAAVGTVSTIDFNSVLTPPATIASFSDAAGLTINGINFVGPASGLGFCPTGYCLNVIAQEAFILIPAGTYLGAPTHITVTLPTPTRGVAFDTWLGFLAAYPGPSTAPITLTLSNGQVQDVTVTNELTFVGIVADTPFTTLQVQSTGTFLHMGDFASEVPEAVAEPSMSAIAAVALGAALRRRRRRAASLAGPDLPVV